MSVNMLAAKMIASREDIPLADRRALLEILGLVDIGGREVLPDGIRAQEPPTMVNQGRSRGMDPDDVRVSSRHSAPPAGLRVSLGAARDTGVGAD